MQKIVLLIPKLNVLGGVERIITEYAEWINENTDSEITIVKLNSGNNAYKLSDKIRIIEFKSNSKNRATNIFKRLLFCKKTFRRIQPDIIYCTYPKPILIAKLTKPKKTKIIGSEHSVPKYRGKKEEKLRYYSSNFCDGFIFQTKDVKKDYPKKIQKKSIVIPNAISIKQIQNPPKKENLILSMGRLEKVKAFDELINICSPILQQNKDYRLEIIGEGKEKNNLEKQIQKQGLKEQIVLLGKIDKPWEKIAEAKIFALTSKYEGFSNSLVEAMALGTCCVSYDCDYGPRNIIDTGQTGMLIKNRDSKKMEEVIKLLLQNERKRKTIEKNALEKALSFNPNIIYKKYYDYFKTIGDQ